GFAPGADTARALAPARGRTNHAAIPTTISLIFMTLSPSASGFPDGLADYGDHAKFCQCAAQDRDSRPLCQAERLAATLHIGEGVAGADAQRPPSLLRIGHPGQRPGIASERSVG